MGLSNPGHPGSTRADNRDGDRRGRRKEPTAHPHDH